MGGLESLSSTALSLLQLARMTTGIRDTYHLFVGGKEVAGRGDSYAGAHLPLSSPCSSPSPRFTISDPATGKAIATCDSASPEDVSDAIA